MTTITIKQLREAKWNKLLYHTTHANFKPNDIAPGSHFGTLHAAMARAKDVGTYGRDDDPTKIHAYAYKKDDDDAIEIFDPGNKTVKRDERSSHQVYRNKVEDPKSTSHVIWDTQNLRHVHTFKKPKFMKRSYADKLIKEGKTIQQLRELNLSSVTASKNIRVAKPLPTALMKPGAMFGVEKTTAAEMIRNRMQGKKALPQQPLIPGGQSALGAGVNWLRKSIKKIREAATLTEELFKTYDEADMWIKKKTKEYGSKMKFLSSDEYKKVWPHIKDLYNKQETEHQTNLKTAAPKAMDEVGVKYGDRVSYFSRHMLGLGGTSHYGTLVNKKGVPHVKLDKKTQGRVHVIWNKGWKKAEKESQSALGAGIKAIGKSIKRIREATTNPEFRYRELERLARKKGVYLDFQPPYPKSIKLDYIGRQNAKKGVGSEILQRANKEADRTNIEIVGSPIPTKNKKGKLIPNIKLIDYYKRHGYKVVGKDKEGFPIISRKPKKQLQEATTNPNFRAKELMRLARMKGVDLDIGKKEIYDPKTGEMSIDPKVVKGNKIENIKRVPGAGRKILHAINKEADRTDTPLTLDVWRKRQNKLIPLYKDLGYKETGYYGYHGPEMNRSPNKRK